MVKSIVVVIVCLLSTACQRPTVSSSVSTQVQVQGKGMAGSVGVGLYGNQPRINVSGSVTPQLKK